MANNARITIREHFEQEDCYVAICQLTATSTSTGETVTMDGCCYYKTQDGTITYAENYWNFIDFFEQVGTLDAGTFAKGLTGGDPAQG